MATEVSQNEILQCCLIEENIPINFDEWKIEWGRSLEGMPVFTVKEIEDHKKESGKNGATIERTSKRGFQVREWDFISNNSELFYAANSSLYINP